MSTASTVSHPCPLAIWGCCRWRASAPTCSPRCWGLVLIPSRGARLNASPGRSDRHGTAGRVSSPIRLRWRPLRPNKPKPNNRIAPRSRKWTAAPIRRGGGWPTIRRTPPPCAGYRPPPYNARHHGPAPTTCRLRAAGVHAAGASGSGASVRGRVGGAVGAAIHRCQVSGWRRYRHDTAERIRRCRHH